MNPASPLQLGDRVEVVGPNIIGHADDMGDRFKIDRTWAISSGVVYSGYGHAWFPASSLCKVEELQMGDWVEVVGDPCPPYRECPEHETGMIFQIAQIDQRNREWFSAPCIPTYPASSLQKLTPDEIPHGQTIGEAMQEFSSEVEKAKDAIRDILAPLVDERLSAIEERHDKIIDCLRRLATLTHGLAQIAELHEGRFDDIDERQESIDGYITRIANVGAALERRLAFVEAFQKEQIENALDPKTLPRTDLTLDAMITDGTLEVADFRKQDSKTQRKIIRELEEDLANGRTCTEYMGEVDRIAALDYAIRSLRMPDMDNDPEFAHRAADVLEEMMEEMQK
ncbi:MAG: hypothetical protein WC455_12960 [Dehalococcoidia bacterium]|jgi:hypothetical protein